MKPLIRNLGLLFLGATFMSSAVLPVSLHAASPQTEQQRKEKRYYDKQHKDYHTWNDAEDRAYRNWLESRHEKYRDFSRMSAKEQQEYWIYRHK